MISTGNEKQYGSGTGTSDNNFNNNKSDIGSIADCNGSSVVMVIIKVLKTMY